MHQRLDELLDSVPGYAQRLWTSVSTLRSPGGPPRELCWLINRAIRLDDQGLLQPLMVLLLLLLLLMHLVLCCCCCTDRVGNISIGSEYRCSNKKEVAVW